MKKLAALLGVVILGISASSMRADGIGMPVAGTFTFNNDPNHTNFFNGNFGFVPVGYGNYANDGSAVVVGSGIEFGLRNQTDLVAANFTGNTFNLSQSCLAANCGTSAYTVTFFTAANLGYTVQAVSFPGLSYSYFYSAALNGYLASLSYDGKGTGTGSATFNYVSNYSTSAVPEPGTISLMATGLLGAAGAIRRRFKA